MILPPSRPHPRRPLRSPLTPSRPSRLSDTIAATAHGRARGEEGQVGGVRHRRRRQRRRQNQQRSRFWCGGGGIGVGECGCHELGGSGVRIRVVRDLGPGIRVRGFWPDGRRRGPAQQLHGLHGVLHPLAFPGLNLEVLAQTGCRCNSTILFCYQEVPASDSYQISANFPE